MSASTGSISSHVGQSRFTTATKPFGGTLAAALSAVFPSALEAMAGGYAPNLTACLGLAP